MNTTLLLISCIAFYQAQKYLLQNRTLWSLFQNVKIHTPTFIPFELEHQEQHAFYYKKPPNTIANPYKRNVLWYSIVFL